MHLFSVQVQLVSFTNLSNSLILTECEWQLELSWIGHKGLHFIIAVPLIWWHWHLSVRLDVMTDWLSEKLNWQISGKCTKDRMNLNHLRNNIRTESWDSGHFFKNGGGFKWGLFSKLFTFLQTDLNITIAIIISKRHEKTIEGKLARAKVTLLKSLKQSLWSSSDEPYH